MPIKNTVVLLRPSSIMSVSDLKLGGSVIWVFQSIPFIPKERVINAFVIFVGEGLGMEVERERGGLGEILGATLGRMLGFFVGDALGVRARTAKSSVEMRMKRILSMV